MDIFYMDLLEKQNKKMENKLNMELEQSEKLGKDNIKYQTSDKINKILDDFELNMCSQINKIKCKMNFDIFGPPGISKMKPFDPIEISNLLNKMFGIFEEQVNDEIEKLKNEKNDIIKSLQPIEPKNEIFNI